MTHSPRKKVCGSAMRQHLLDAVDIGLVDHHAGAQLTLSLAGLLGEDVTSVGLAALEAFRRLAKALRRRPVCFQLGHRSLPLSFSPITGGAPNHRHAAATGGAINVPPGTSDCSLLFRCEHHHHLLALHQRLLLDHGMACQVLLHAIEELASDVLMHHFTAAET